MLECRSAGVLECRSAGVLECWSAGVQSRRVNPECEEEHVIETESKTRKHKAGTQWVESLTR